VIAVCKIPPSHSSPSLQKKGDWKMPLEDYEEILNHFKSPILVLAGPGAGKTHLLADRVKLLLSNGVDKDTITVLTFGKDANRHMIEELINPKGIFNIPYSSLPHISTMHSLSLSIVQEKPHLVNLKKADLQVQNEEDVKRLLFRDAALILGYTEAQGFDASKCKSCGDCSEPPSVECCEICTKYREIMSKCNYIDFDDQIHFACQILENFPDILDKYQSQVKHLLVDEYQDINAAQFKLIKFLSGECLKGLFVVGDDAQSIYSFRGGDPKFILRFEDDFPGAEVATLAYSRRCHKNIMEPSCKILEKYYPNQRTKKLNLKYLKEEGDSPYLYFLASNNFEAKVAAAIARDAIQEKKTVLILAPKKDFFPLLIKELTRKQVPYNCSIDLLPERMGIAKRFIDWVQKPNDTFITRLVIEDLINKGIAAVAGAKKNGRSTALTIKNRIAVETNIAKLWDFVERGNDMFSVIKNHSTGNKTLETIKESLLQFEKSYNDSRKANRGEFAKELASITGIWIEPSKMAEDIAHVVNLIQAEQPFSSISAQLLTMRKAKGLEAQIVIIVGLEDDIIPNPRSDSIDEEARLLYVSMTRAEEKLYLFHSFKRPRNISYGPELSPKERSRFLDVLGRKSEFKRPTQS
jgi:DNA helicase-2/ATP-dependent DNA helicase PcrA